MGRSYAEIFSLILAVLLTPLFAAAQDLGGGTAAELKRYILPQYHGDDNQLQFVVYGQAALNKGSLLALDSPIIDVVDERVRTLREIETLRAEDPLPEAYPLEASAAEIIRFWANPKYAHARAWVFSNKAVFNKTTKVFSSDDVAHFRSREMDVDGIGYDAYPERKFIHIRSKVRIRLRLNFHATGIPQYEPTQEGNES